MAGVAGALVGGTLSDQLGRRKMLVVSLLGTPLLMFGLLRMDEWGRFPLLLALGFTGLMVTPGILHA